jgi:hypothetical protein
MNESLPLEHNMYRADNSTLQKIDQKYLEIFEMWYWKWTEKVIWNDGAKNEVLHRMKDERNDVENKIIIIIIFINCNWVVTRWQWLFYMCTKHEIGYYWI